MASSITNVGLSHEEPAGQSWLAVRAVKFDSSPSNDQDVMYIMKDADDMIDIYFLFAAGLG